MKNTIALTAPNEGSPFDSIRHTDENGQEYWLARELQKILGYAKWQKFEAVIEVAAENLETVTDDVAQHLTPTGKLSCVSVPVPLQDYKLSRLACYHVALCCDSRGKVEVKLAKHYFVVKAHKAEIAEVEARTIAADSFNTLASGQLMEIRNALMNPSSLSLGELGVLTEGVSPGLIAKIGALTNEQYVKLYLTLRTARVPQDVQDQKDSGVFDAEQLKIADKTIERFEWLQKGANQKWQQTISSTVNQKTLRRAS